MDDDKLLGLLRRLTEDSAVLLDSEEATKQGIILPILSRVGWDRDNVREVIPEYRIENGRVDYCLHVAHKNVVFIEAKRTDQQLDQHQEQLLDYAFREGVELAALTNGVVWWLYLPLLQGSWEQRKFFTIDISQQDPAAVADHFRNYIGKEAVANGSAFQRAKSLHESRAKERLTKTTLPKAWQQLLDGPDELLAELLAERVESLCGHQPTLDQVADFLAQAVGRPHPPLRPHRSRPNQLPLGRPPARAGVSSTGSYTFRRPASFNLLGKNHPASTWKKVLIGICVEIARRHPDDFDKVLSLKGRKRDYFSHDYRGMTSPEKIPGTITFVETNLSANDVAKRCQQILRLFGYKSADFEVLTD